MPLKWPIDFSSKDLLIQNKRFSEQYNPTKKYFIKRVENIKTLFFIVYGSSALGRKPH